eukprot:scaffold2390_cov125-Isochrysis_galbana.AAC.2
MLLPSRRRACDCIGSVSGGWAKPVPERPTRRGLRCIRSGHAGAGGASAVGLLADKAGGAQQPAGATHGGNAAVTAEAATVLGRLDPAARGIGSKCFGS